MFDIEIQLFKTRIRAKAWFVKLNIVQKFSSEPWFYYKQCDKFPIDAISLIEQRISIKQCAKVPVNAASLIEQIILSK